LRDFVHQVINGFFLGFSLLKFPQIAFNEHQNSHLKTVYFQLVIDVYCIDQAAGLDIK
jgi:hypothetical protein